MSLYTINHNIHFVDIFYSFYYGVVRQMTKVSLNVLILFKFCEEFIYLLLIAISVGKEQSIL